MLLKSIWLNYLYLCLCQKGRTSRFSPFYLINIVIYLNICYNNRMSEQESKDSSEYLHQFENIEYDISEFLLYNKEAIQCKIHTLYRPGYHLFPSSLMDFYLDSYRLGALNIIKNEVSSSFNVNPEVLNLLITDPFITLLDKDFLVPKKHER